MDETSARVAPQAGDLSFCDAGLSPLAREHQALMAAYGRAQRRCSERLAAQQAQIDRLTAELMRARAHALVRETQRAWALDVPRPPRGRPLAIRLLSHRPAGGEADPLEAALVAADLVICQTGCLGHDAYWRVQDHCRRTGKTCVLVDLPQAPRRSASVDSGR
ncbi:MAG: DUF2325 domain-containing protein [Burkholderiaceae bacterium]|nr:DUF2325 domain-containing protein [Burkholderiaceae bacterium]